MLPRTLRDGLLRGACHRARIRATRWLAMTELAMTEMERRTRVSETAASKVRAAALLQNYEIVTIATAVDAIVRFNARNEPRRETTSRKTTGRPRVAPFGARRSSP